MVVVVESGALNHTSERFVIFPFLGNESESMRTWPSESGTNVLLCRTPVAKPVLNPWTHSQGMGWARVEKLNPYPYPCVPNPWPVVGFRTRDNPYLNVFKYRRSQEIPFRSGSLRPVVFQFSPRKDSISLLNAFTDILSRDVNPLIHQHQQSTGWLRPICWSLSSSKAPICVYPFIFMFTLE